MRKLLIGIVILVGVFLLPVIQIHADEYDDITKQLQDLRKSLDSSQQATKNNEQSLAALNKKLDGIKYQVSQFQKAIDKKEAEVKTGEEKLSDQQKILQQRTISHYKNLNNTNLSLINVLVADDFSKSIQDFFYQKSLIDKDTQTILQVVAYIQDLEEKKTSLEKQSKQMLAIKTEVDKQSQFLAGEVSKAKQYESVLSGQIAELSAKQQQIVNAKGGGSFTASIGDSEDADDYNASIKGFRESAPSGYFGVFSFGAFTHRNGMSQYGARGRAMEGQNFTDILRAYYGKDPVDKDTGGDINVAGYGSMNFEERYLLGLAEMPASWPMEALKAQAIAARSFALRYKSQGKEICVTEACQVFSASKADNPPAQWRQAVQETKGKVIEDVVTYYASVHGGYINGRGWDTKDGGGGSNFIDKAWEKVGGAPWLYKAWYRNGYTNSGDSCGRSNAWMSPQEMADIVNAHLVLTKSGDAGERDRVTPITTSCWGGNPYSIDDLRNVASKYGGISSADNVSVSQGDGTTASVTINGITMSGAEFDKAFTLRAPGYLRIPQTGFSFFNIERK